MVFLEGSGTGKQKKPCKHCRNFLLWGVSTGHCWKHNEDVNCKEHCKYYKRDIKIWFKNGKCKVNEFELYV